MKHENSGDQRPEQDFLNSDPGTYNFVTELYNLDRATDPQETAQAVANNPTLIMREYEELQLEIQDERQRSLVDPLTELPNRRAWDRAMEAVDEGYFGENPAIVVIDLDHFKLINDKAGHEVGNAVLRGVASTLSRYVRCSDQMFFRPGGDEFTGIMPESTPDQHPDGRRGKTPQSPEDRIASIREHLEADLQPIFEEYAEYNLGASIGVAIRTSAMSADEVTHAADQDSARIKAQHKQEEFFRLPVETRREIRKAHLRLEAVGVELDPRVYGHSFDEDDASNPEA